MRAVHALVTPDDNHAKMKKMTISSKKITKTLAGSKNSRTFATAMTKWEVLYGQLLVNPPGLDRSKGSRS